MKCMKKITALVLTGIMSIALAQPLSAKAACPTISFGKQYTETNTRDTWTFNSVTNSSKQEENCRVITTKSAGKLTITGNSNADVRIYLYDRYGGSEISNKSTNRGKFTISANISKGTHYMKFWECSGNCATVNYKVTFSPNKIFTKKKALAFNKNNKEYLVDCNYNTAMENRKTADNCRKIVIPAKKKKLTITAYSLGDSYSDVRVFIYDSKGKKVLTNWSVSDGKKSTTVKVKKGTYYMKFWECSGNNAEFHYKLKVK